LTFFGKIKNEDFEVGGEAQEQIIVAQEQNIPRVFRNLDSPLYDKISSLNNSRRYHDPNQLSNH